MKIYDESGALLDACDLSLGYLTTVRRKVSRTPAHLVVMPGTDGLRRRVPEKVEYEAVQIYHPYTEEQLAAQRQPTQLERVEAQAVYTAMMTDTLLEV